MFISRKEYRKAIKRAEKKGIEKANQNRWKEERMERLERNLYEMHDKLHSEILEIKAKTGIYDSDKKTCTPVPFVHAELT